MSVQIPCLLLNWSVFSCMSSPYILDVSPWSEAWMKYFLPFARLPFISLASFAVCTAPSCLWNTLSPPILFNCFVLLLSSKALWPDTFIFFFSNKAQITLGPSDLAANSPSCLTCTFSQPAREGAQNIGPVILLQSPQVLYCPWSSGKGPSSNGGALPLEKCFHAQYGSSLVPWVQSNVWKQTWL